MEFLTFMAAAITIVSVILLVIAFTNRCDECGSLGHAFSSDKLPDYETGQAFVICKNAAPRRTKVLLAPMARCCGSVHDDGREAESSTTTAATTAIVAVMVATAGAAFKAWMNKDTGKLPPHFSFRRFWLAPFYAVFCPLRSAQPRL